MPIALTRASIVVASPDQVSSDLGGESVLLDLRTAQYFGMPGVASRIWSLISSPARVEDIVGAIVQEYDVSPEQCEADVLTFLGRLHDRGLIEVRVGG